jgi:hypothetical protein
LLRNNYLQKNKRHDAQQAYKHRTCFLRFRTGVKHHFGAFRLQEHRKVPDRRGKYNLISIFDENSSCKTR